MYIAVDIGGTTGRVAGYASPDDPTPVRRTDFPMRRTYQADRPVLFKTIRKVAGNEPIDGIGIGIAGAVDPSGGTITGSGNLAGWHHHPIREDLESEFAVPVKLANDAYVAALSEAVYTDHSRPFWFMIWGTGVGGSYVTPGSPPTVEASEFGHAVIDWDSDNQPCGCGQPGCLESFIGGSKIELNRGKPAAELTEKEWSEVVDHVAQGLHSVIATRPAERVVFGGGVAVKQAHRLSQVADRLEQTLRIYPAPKVSLVAHKEDAGLTGALALLK